MRYLKFEIENYKGIKKASIDLQSATGVNVFPLVGLNESGKTTILEAIHTFSPDLRSEKIVKKESGLNSEDLVPRHQYSIFTGLVTIKATLRASESDKAEIVKDLAGEDLMIRLESIPDTLVSSFNFAFERGDFKEKYRDFHSDIEVKKKGGRKWRKPTDHENRLIGKIIYWNAPHIAYYPTFIFDFPKKIWLSNRGSSVSKFYRDVFDDILAYSGEGFSIKKDILDRVRAEGYDVPWLDFLNKWRAETNRAKINHVIDKAQRIVSKVVFDKWNQIFNEQTGDKQVLIEFDVDEGKIRADDGNFVATNSHDPYVEFWIKDGTRRFEINDRSLGFRWFFAFLLFTQFRTARETGLPTLFLFDEPASNLHAAAQQQLIAGFPEIATGDNMLMYSTHSHYMVEPKWLEQTFIVTNRADSPETSVIDAAVLDDESLDIKAVRYKRFVNDNPNQTSYFQPIIDTLNVVPSRFDYHLPSVVLEGKSDFYILKYAEELYSLGNVRLIPGVGAGTFEALISLSSGWGLKFLFVLDADDKGEEEKLRYAAETGAPVSALLTLSEIDPEVVEIEDLFDSEARSIVAKELGQAGPLTKKHFLRFTQEMLAKNESIDLGEHFRSKSTKLIEALSVRLSA